jgi:hypothetical protein
LVGKQNTGYLRALGEEGSHNLGLIRLQLPTEVSFEHRSGHSDYLLVTKGETQQCPPIPCSRVTQAILFEMEMEMVICIMFVACRVRLCRVRCVRVCATKQNLKKQTLTKATQHTHHFVML